jgi:hypothetical protein
MTSQVKILGTEMTLTTANTVSNAGLIRLVETGGSAASLITQRDANNTVIGTITLPKNSELVIRKARTDTLTSSAGTVLAVPVTGSFS